MRYWLVVLTILSFPQVPGQFTISNQGATNGEVNTTLLLYIIWLVVLTILKNISQWEG